MSVERQVNGGATARSAQAEARRSGVAVFLVVGLLAATSAACQYGSGENEVHWTEAVSLADGSTVEIQRYVRFHWRRSWGIGGASTGEGERESRLRFLGSLQSLQMWSGPLIPVFLDRDPKSGDFVLITTTANCSYWNRNGEPTPPYWNFRLRGERWEHTTIPESFYGRAANLFFDYSDKDNGDLTAVVSERKRKQSEYGVGDFYKQVVRVSRDLGCTPSVKR